MTWRRTSVLAAVLIVLAIIFTALFYNRTTIAPIDSIPTLKIILKVSDSFNATNNVYIEELEDRLNMNLEIITVNASSYNDRLNIIMAQGGAPDIIQVNWSGEGNLPGWVRKGLIAPIDLEQAPNIEMNVSPSLISLMRMNEGDDTQVYGVPGITSSYPYGTIIRKDWLTNLQLEAPHTLDEYVETMTRFVEEDPDGNDKADTLGFTSWRLNHFGGVFGGAFKIDYLWDSLHPDMSDGGQHIKFREEQQGYIAFLDFAKQAFENNWLDKDIVNLQSAENKFILGKVGMIGGYSNKTLYLEKELKKFDPNAQLEWIPGPSDPEGRLWNFAPESYGFNGSGSMLGSNAVFAITEGADYEAALRFLDRMNSPEMIFLSNLGIQGRHYEEYDVNRNIIKRTSKQNEAVHRELFGISDAYRGETLVSLGDNEQENERLYYYRQKGRILITNPLSFSMGMVPEVVRFQQMNPSFNEMERAKAISYVMGVISRDDYMGYLVNENLNKRKFLSEAMNQKYRQLIELQ